MKARTKLEKRIEKIGDRLKAVPKRAVFDLQTYFDNTGTQYKSGQVNCLMCGHQWKPKIKLRFANLRESYGNNTPISECSCPKCKKRLTVYKTQTRTFDDTIWGFHLQIKNEFQIIRLVEIKCYKKVGQKIKFWHYNPFSYFISTETGQFYGYGSYINSSFYNRNWCGFNEVRKIEKSKYSFKPYCVSKQSKIHMNLQQRGYDTVNNLFSNANYLYGIRMNISNPHFETIVKSIPDYADYIQDRMKVKEFLSYWPTLKIALRHKFDFPNPHDYFDYLRQLKRFDKDLKNPFYICPENFDKAHNYYSDKIRKTQEEERKKIKIQEDNKRLLRLEKQSKSFEKRYAKFKRLRFKTKGLVIKPILSLDELMKAARDCKHCISGENYINDKTSIYFATYSGDVIVETTQISLDTFEILQSRGLYNKNTKYTIWVSDILNMKMPLIKRFAIQPKKKRKKKPQKVA